MIINNTIAARIIVALDVNDRETALSLIRELPEAEVFKIGMRLFTAEGPDLLKEVLQLGKKVFLDLKFHDIPNQVAGAVTMAVRHEVTMLTLHASGGSEMLKKSAEAAQEAAAAIGKSQPLLLAVTVLTSLKDAQLDEIGMEADAAGQVLRLADLARAAGINGVVCSPQEIELIRSRHGHDFLVVTPGIRPEWAAANDQKRIMTPVQAVTLGANYLVIGRPIIASPSPQKAFQKILEELA
jgi:orotidine-5'-phosphate decarboxylase